VANPYLFHIHNRDESKFSRNREKYPDWDIYNQQNKKSLMFRWNPPKTRQVLADKQIENRINFEE